jgi:hypothetical protein
MKIAIVYLGAYNTFDFCYPTHKKNLFDILENEGLDYDIYASVANEIVLKDPNKDFLNNVIETFKDHFLKHLPENIELILSSDHPSMRWWNFYANKITSQINYTDQQFKLIFKDKLKFLNTENNFNEQNKKVALSENLHEPLDFYKSTFFNRLKLIDNIIDDYDLYIYLRPDLILNNLLNVINDFTKLEEKEKNKFIFYQGRLDWLFLSKYKLTYFLDLFKDEIIQKSLKLNQMEIIFMELMKEKGFKTIIYDFNRLDVYFLNKYLIDNPNKILEL